MFRFSLASLLIAMTGAFCPIELGAEEPTPLYGQKASLFETLGVPEGSIVFLGNSLTGGCEWNELFHRTDIINRGISGDTADGIYERLESIVSGKSSKLFLMVGINDISHNLPADTIAEKTCRIIDYIREHSTNTKIYLQSCLPINNSFGRYKAIFGKEKEVPLLNDALMKVAKQRGVTWIDLYPLFADENGLLRTDLTNDGLHLLAPGYIIWRDKLMPYINE